MSIISFGLHTIQTGMSAENSIGNGGRVSASRAPEVTGNSDGTAAAKIIVRALLEYKQALAQVSAQVR